jgi:hypothetical protein
MRVRPRSSRDASARLEALAARFGKEAAVEAVEGGDYDELVRSAAHSRRFRRIIGSEV